jgi:hypothetical protein
MLGLFLAWLDIVTMDLPRAVVGRPYQPALLAVAGGVRCTMNNIGTRVVLGELPPGLTLSMAGYLRGKPVRTGNYTFAIRAGNDCGYTTRAYTLKVDAAPLLHLSVERVAFAWKAGMPAPAAQTFTVASSWPDLPYDVAVDGNAPWLRVRPWRGYTPLPDSGFRADPVTLTVDPARLAPGVYRTELVVSAWEAVEVIRVPVVLTVEAAETPAPKQ